MERNALGVVYGKQQMSFLMQREHLTVFKTGATSASKMITRIIETNVLQLCVNMTPVTRMKQEYVTKGTIEIIVTVVLNIKRTIFKIAIRVHQNIMHTWLVRTLSDVLEIKQSKIPLQQKNVN